MSNWPDKVCDDEQLNDAVDDAHGPALDHHRLGGLIGEEVSDTAHQHGAHSYLTEEITDRSGPLGKIWRKSGESAAPLASTGAFREPVTEGKMLKCERRSWFWRQRCGLKLRTAPVFHSLLWSVFICSLHIWFGSLLSFSLFVEMVCATNRTSPSSIQINKRRMCECPVPPSFSFYPDHKSPSPLPLFSLPLQNITAVYFENQSDYSVHSLCICFLMIPFQRVFDISWMLLSDSQTKPAHSFHIFWYEILTKTV